MKQNILMVMALIILSVVLLVGCQKVSHVSPAIELCAWVIEDENTNNNMYGVLLPDNSPSSIGEKKELVNNYLLFYSPCQNKKVIHFDITKEEYTSKVKEIYPQFFTEMLDPRTGETTEIMKPPTLPDGSIWKTWNKDIVKELGLNVIDDLTVYKCSPTEEPLYEGENPLPPREEEINQLINEGKLGNVCEKV